eukprot:Blabericola_migrator_1__13069@NODE_883_length_6173_cov_565_747625_g623_i0_p4_GENE_NODE_883_length_6173_cov_565_747625_g623_i0NODE_883_length_6173_cov_565_747625_g623_i0_p4_ORF_typecomplete_len252_score36_90ABC1/PF03109_16/1_6e06zfRING_9/PF13901_6/0_035_NODE_883_length_6173_cov_565_747625_g623_i036034358
MLRQKWYDRKTIQAWLARNWDFQPQQVSSRREYEYIEALKYSSSLEPQDFVSRVLLKSLDVLEDIKKCVKSTCQVIPLMPLTPLMIICHTTGRLKDTMLTHNLASFYYKWSANIIAGLGPTEIKFLQWASTRNDLFPGQFCQIMRGYQASVPPDPLPYTCLLYAASLRKAGKHCGLISPHCFGSGSVAQVYHTLGHVEGGSDCYYRRNVSKVLRPFVQKQIRKDLRLARLAFKMVNLIPGDWKEFIPLNRR